MKAFFILTLYLAMVAPAVAKTGNSVSAGTFLPAERSLWREESFKGHTDYKFIPEGTTLALKAN